MAWCFFETDSVPERWRERGRQVIFIPLLPDEAKVVSELPKAKDQDEPLLHLVAAGRSRQEIARELALPLRTVDRKLSSLAARFGLTTTSELVSLLARLGF